MPLAFIKARWSLITALPPFFDTVNEQPDLNDMPDKWGSAIIQVDSRVDVTMGSNPYVEERGNVIIGLFARAGTGAEILDSEITALRAAFQGYVKDEAEGTFQLLSVDGPLDIDPESDGDWWRLALSVPYTYQSRRTEPPAPVERFIGVTLGMNREPDPLLMLDRPIDIETGDKVMLLGPWASINAKWFPITVVDIPLGQFRLMGVDTSGEDGFGSGFIASVAESS
jgi:hypothetical protein